MREERKSVFIHILRIISAYAVVVGHISHQFGLLVIDNYSPFPIQNIAVIIFFIISGYLAGNSFLLHKEEWGVEDYLRNRFIRIYPMFLLSFFLVIYCDTIVLRKFNLDYMFRNNFSIVMAIANLMLLQMFPRTIFGGGGLLKEQ